MTENRAAMLTGLGAGASLMYFLDPARGARRRALMRDRLTRATRTAGSAAGATGRDLAHRASGAAARLRGTMRRDTPDDRVLLERVRSQIGRAVSHPRAIDVDVIDGLVTLRGPILMDEVSELLNAVERVRGVRDIVNNLEEHSEPGNVPSLQGRRSQRRTRSDLSQWSPSAKLATCMAATAGFGLMARAATRVR